MRMASRQNRVRDQVSHSNNNNKNIKPEDLKVYHDGSVIKDQSRWGFMSNDVRLPSMKTAYNIIRSQVPA